MAIPLRNDRSQFDRSEYKDEPMDQTRNDQAKTDPAIDQTSIDQASIDQASTDQKKIGQTKTEPRSPNVSNPRVAAFPVRNAQVERASYAPHPEAADETNAPLAAERAHLFPNDEMLDLQTRWKAIQTNFVDDPQSAVRQADELVASAAQRLTEVSSNERSRLTAQWDRGEGVSTEDLRLTMQRYRSLFDQLLKV